jgi:tetratricopeptide (TPR) repeat protein
MERRWQLDLAGNPARRLIIRSLVLFLALVPLRSQGQACEIVDGRQSSPAAGDFNNKIRQLFEQSRWQEIVDNVTPLSAPDAHLRYYYGIALAQLGRCDEARSALVTGYRLAPLDKRFPVELAGIAYKQKRYCEAAGWLHRALRLDPKDDYANDFLGAVYFLQGNLEAALKYWNRIDKPRINAVYPEHLLQIRPALLDHALAFAPASPLTLPDLLTSRARVEGLGVFRSVNFQLAAHDDGNFDVVLNFDERNRWGNNSWQALLSTFRGVAYQTVYPEYFNLRRSATNITSLVRWDDQKRRFAVDVLSSLHQNPKWRYRLGVDLRNENWAIRDSFAGIAPLLGALNLRREAASAEIMSFSSGLWAWSAGMEVSHRDYREVDPGTTLTPHLMLEGMQLKQMATIHHEVWRVPDRRLIVSSGASSQLARIWSQPAQLFEKMQGSLSLQWFPETKGDDYATQVQIRGGGTTGKDPFDELYMLGLERDNDLWLRAHIATRDGRKGSAPLGRRYFLANTEVDKDLYSDGLLSLKLSPFLDNGKVNDAFSQLGTPEWLWDTGLQTKLRILGVGLTFIWGRDLRTGHNAFYFTTAK